MNGKKKRFLVGVASLVLGLAAQLALAGAGGNTTEGFRHIKVSGGIQLNGQELKDGTYRLSWKPSGDGVDVRLDQGSRQVATVSGKLVERGDSSLYDAVVYLPNASGKQELVEIRFAGSKSAISLKGEGAGGQAASR